MFILLRYVINNNPISDENSCKSSCKEKRFRHNFCKMPLMYASGQTDGRTSIAKLLVNAFAYMKRHSFK